MKHWDLVPGETVTIERDGERLRGWFAFRTTVLACFELETRGDHFDWREFDLLGDGRLRDRERPWARIWSIAGPDRNTRTVVAQTPLTVRRRDLTP